MVTGQVAEDPRRVPAWPAAAAGCFGGSSLGARGAAPTHPLLYPAGAAQISMERIGQCYSWLGPRDMPGPGWPGVDALLLPRPLQGCLPLCSFCDRVLQGGPKWCAWADTSVAPSFHLAWLEEGGPVLPLSDSDWAQARPPHLLRRWGAGRTGITTVSTVSPLLQKSWAPDVPTRFSGFRGESLNEELFK